MCECIKNLARYLGDVTEYYKSGTQMRKCKRPVNQFLTFFRSKGIAKIKDTFVMAKIFNLDVVEGDIEELVQLVPEKLMNVELL